MLRSMTGFGKAAVEFRNSSITVEIKSLNHRFFDITSRLPGAFYPLEIALGDQVKKQIKRGSVNLNLIVESVNGRENTLFLDDKLAKRYHLILNQLKKSLKLKGEIGLAQLMAFPNIISYKEKPKDINAFYPAVKLALERAVRALIVMREKEGKAIFNDLSKRAAIIEKVLGNIEQRANATVKIYKEKLLKRVKQLAGAGNLDKERLETEVALFAKNCDIQEEITRLLSHIDSFRKALKEKGEVGKKLDFIAQEMYRETNTIGQKASDFKISEGIIQIKGEVEKIREQVQNVE